MWAAEHGRVDIMTLLQDRGASIEHTDDVSYHHALVNAIQFNH